MSIKCSVCILTYNSGKTIEKCLESVKDFTDIVILDGGSSDRTIEISKKYNVRVYPQHEGHSEKIIDFTTVRQKLFSFAKEDWIMWLDSDEWLDAETVKKIEEVLGRNDSSKLYALKRKVVIGEKKIEYAYFYPEFCNRLFNKNSSVSLKGNKKVHEGLIAGQGVDIERIDGIIYHLWSERYRDLIKKDNHYLTLTVKGKEWFPFRRKAWVAFINILKGSKVFLRSTHIYIAHGFRETLPIKYSWRFVRYHLIYAKKMILL
ncbi:glycosyltransferase family 2 protein [Candidatus Parcubacteria bacterium]|nr:glycosyltransferase family 2 protein [Candidatus Parcubacteria bacterium]